MGTRIARKLAESLLTNNEISPDNPYTLLTLSGHYNSTVFFLLVQTNGLKRPQRCFGRAFIRRIKGWDLYVGSTIRSSFYKKLPEMLALRDAYNLIHRIKMKKQKVTVEIMQSVTDPKMKQELIEACCLAAI